MSDGREGEIANERQVIRFGPSHQQTVAFPHLGVIGSVAVCEVREPAAGGADRSSNNEPVNEKSRQREKHYDDTHDRVQEQDSNHIKLKIIERREKNGSRVH